ncbi:hypothetical protein SAMN05661091_1395 [Paenibacillus uliginis N3/975]|uniref:Uncharacterized protein n=1 Tax=Paenibacillus uliginis N3/975 TaxID=1313296 RepID=A0A1X7GZM8_9BACL|nr:hypothetical protein SAMN05661091_1395 [Paenibacillus uliginis N3/975]
MSYDLMIFELRRRRKGSRLWMLKTSRQGVDEAVPCIISQSL